MTYKKSEDLENKILEEKDYLDFLGLRYEVVNNALINNDNVSNDKIFMVLGIKDKYEFCAKYYKYRPLNTLSVIGQFPTSKKNDYEALTRVAVALMELCES